MFETAKETANFIQEKTKNFQPQIGIILGTGLGGLVTEIEIAHTLEYADIPNFPVSTVESHQGRLIFGTLSGKNVVAMQGRFHSYEGYSMQEITFPVRVMKLLGIQYLFVSNACGAVNPNINAGELMILTDHINLLYGNPLTGKNADGFGPRFPDMSQPYDRNLVNIASDIAEKHNIDIHKGVYVAVPGPNLETRAEYRYLQIIGADVVGMSTVPEIIAARHMNIPCFAISVITDEGWVEDLQPLTLEMVIAAAKKAEPQMTLIIKELTAAI